MLVWRSFWRVLLVVLMLVIGGCESVPALVPMAEQPQPILMIPVCGK